MNEFDLDLLLKYPLVNFQTSEDIVFYKGFISLEHVDYEICITKETNDNSFRVLGTNDLIQFEEEIKSINKLKLKNVVNILDQIKSLIESKIPKTYFKNNSTIYKHVLSEYSEFTKFYLNLKQCELSSDLAKVTVSTLDEGNREHFLEIVVNFDEASDIFAVKKCDLPKKYTNDTNLFEKCNSLSGLYDKFLGYVEFLQPFWNLMDTFDRSSCVLDPEIPQRSDHFRRLWLGDNVSIIITIDPYNVYNRPDLKFLGPEKIVEEFRFKINENLRNWNNITDIYQEILNLIGLECFPHKSDTSERAVNVLREDGECSICFSYRLNEKLPEIICKNKSCQNVYHAECLYEWIITVNAKKNFNEVKGQCPNCEKGISCPISLL